LGISGRDGRYRVRKSVEVPTRDGFYLLTDHYAPDTGEAGGTILIRGPYGRTFPNSAVYGGLFAAAGYHVLIQSVRGTFGSTDAFQPFVMEADDAQDTVSWLRSQTWFDGRLATIGGSYLGFVQWALLANAPAELRAAVIVVGPHDFGRVLHGNGVFSLSLAFAWSEAMTSQPSIAGALSRLLGIADRRTRPALYGLPLAEAAESVLKDGAPWYRDWLLHDDPADKYWDAYRYEPDLSRSTVPILLVGGWYDIFLDQTMEQYRVLHRRGAEVALTVGPWTHLDTIGKGSGLITRETLEWLNRHLADQSQAKRHRPLRIFFTGVNQWRTYDEWPPAVREQVYHLDQPAALRATPGAGTSQFTFDPARPTPVVGGRLFHPRRAGAKDNRSLESRTDVITFTSVPVERDLDIAGTSMVELDISVDNPYADVFVRLCDVDARGTSLNFADAIRRLDPAVPAGQLQHVTLDLDPCAHRLRTGHRLRLLVSGGAHPRYARNLGTGEPLATGKNMKPSMHLVQHSNSRVVLPIESKERSAQHAANERIASIREVNDGDAPEFMEVTSWQKHPD
jgi:putative CocE/NonD family hydrolase